MKFLSRRLIAAILVLTMVLSTPGMLTFANSVEDAVETEVAKEDAIEDLLEEEQYEEEAEDYSEDTTFEENNLDPDSLDLEKEEETEKMEENASEDETEVVAETTAEQLDESQNASTEETVAETEVATTSEADELVDETTVVTEESVATTSEAEEIVEIANVQIATKSDAFVLEVANIISKHDDTWKELTQTTIANLDDKKYTQFYLTEDVMLTKYNYGHRDDDEIVTICLHGHQVLFNDNVNLAELNKYINFVDCGGDEEDKSHNEFWSAINQDGFDGASRFPAGDFYLSGDVVLKGSFNQSPTLKTTICLHGHKLTIDSSFNIDSIYNNITFTNCFDKKCDLLNPNNFKFYAASPTACITYENVNIVSGQKLTINSSVVFDNCSFAITTKDTVAIEVKPKKNVEFKNLEFNNSSAGFLIDGATVTFENVNMKNNTAEPLFTIKNSSVVNVKGTGVYEGNKSIYDLYDSKLNVIDGSGNAKDILREPASAEYYDPVVTKRGTRLLNPDSPGLNIVYKRNVGKHIIKSFNSETVFDGVIVANQFVGAETVIGSWIAAGQDKSKLTLINKAYVNQNRRNILVNDISDIYGSITYDDGTFDTLDRDATLSFYPVRPDMTIMKNVIKKNENSLVLTARNLKSDDEWTTQIADYIFKACMIDGYTNDLYEYENTPEDHPAVSGWVLCDIEDRADGLQQGTFRLGQKDHKKVILRLHLGEGKYKGSTFGPNEINVSGPYDGDTIEVYWRPYFKAGGYQSTFKDSFNTIKVQWIDKSVENEPYEYQLEGWAFTPEHLVSPTGKAATTFLNEGIKTITDNIWERYHSRDVIDLYACWKGDLKQKLVFKVEEEKRSDSHPIPIDYFEDKEMYARVNHPINLPVYESPKDYLYDGFELVGWKEVTKITTQETADYSVIQISDPKPMGSEYTPAHHDEFEDGEEVVFYPEFLGEPHTISWYLGSEGINKVNLTLNADKFYVPEEVKLGQPYSSLKPKVDSSLIAYEFTNFELDDGLEFLGWTKQEIKAPIASASELEDIVFVRDYVKGFSSREDVSYYPVMLKTGLTVEHNGYSVLTAGKLNADGPLEEGNYHLNNDIELTEPKELAGNVTIDLHGKELKFKPGAFFYSSADLVFTDCKYDEPVKADRGRLYNSNGVIYDGSGTLTLRKVAMSGRQAYTFQDLEKEVIMDDVELRQAEWVGVMHDLDKEDIYPRNMQIDNSKVHIKNSTIKQLTGMLYVINGGHLTMTNVTVKNNGGNSNNAEWGAGGIFRAIDESKITINSPAWFEGNRDLFYVIDSNLEINSNADHYDGDLEAIKDDAVIFTNNGTQTLGYLNGGDVKMSGIFVHNPVRIGMFHYYQGTPHKGTRQTKLHYDGFVYVRDNTANSGFGGDMFVHGNDILYYQNDSDRINTNSIIDLYTYWAMPLYFTNCEPDSCRNCFILGNLSDAEKEAFDRNRDEYGNLKNFTLVNADQNNGYQAGLFYAVIDGIHHDDEKNRGWDIVYNQRREQDVVDVYVKMNYDTQGRFYDMDGNIVREAVVQLDKKNPKKFNDWYNNLSKYYIAIDSIGYTLKRELGTIYRRTPFPVEKVQKYDFFETKYDLYKSADYVTLYLTENKTEEKVVDPKYSLLDTYEVNYYTNMSELYDYKGAYYTINVNGGDTVKGLKDNDTHIIRDISLNQTYSEIIGGDYERYTDMFPYRLKGWELIDGDEKVFIEPGKEVNFRKDFIPKNYYSLNAVWEPRTIKVKFMTNDYIRYKNSPTGEYTVDATIGDIIRIPKVFDLDIDPDMTFFGWVTEEDHTHFKVGVEGELITLPHNMYTSKLAQEKVTMRLASLYKLEKYFKEYKIYPVYFPKNELILNRIIESQRKKSERLLFRLKQIGGLDDVTVDNLHVDHEAKKADFFTKESDMTKSICLYEDTTFTGTLNVDGDLSICLHSKNFTINGGKFNLLDNSKITIYNCESNGVVTISNSDFVTNSKKVVFDGVKVNTNTALNFNNKNIDFVNVTFNNVSGNSFVSATNKSYINFVNSTFDNINVSGNYFVSATDEARVNFERMTFDGLAKGFYYNNAEGLFSGVSISNSTANVLFTVNDNAKVNLKEYTGAEGTVHSYFENNKNIALVDNAKFMVSGGSVLDTQNDIVLTDLKGEPTRDSMNGRLIVEKSEIKLLDSAENPINENRLQRVVFKGNTGNYLFGAKNNAKIFFNGIALKNTFTESNGKMGVYVNLAGENTFVLRANPYINQNNRNIVVTSDDYITSDTDEPEYASAGQALSSDATLSFYLTEHKYQRILVGANDGSGAQLVGSDFSKQNYSVKFEDGSVRKNYFFASCMIEGHRDDIFTQYGNNYAGNNMRIVYGQGQDGSSDFGFFAEPYEEKETISIKLNANGGKFKDPSGNDVTTSYTFNYKRSLPDNSIKNWLNALIPTAVDSRDNYEGTFKGWSRLSDAMKGMTVSEILEYESDLELYAYFDYPTLLTLKFFAEKNNNTKLKGKAYDNFDTKTVYVRLTNNNYNGTVVAPAIDITPKNGYIVSTKWETEDTSFNKYLEPGVSTTFQNVIGTTEFNYYLVWTEPEISIKINSQSGIFSDPTGKVVNKNESYTVKFKKYASEDNLTNWLKKLAPKAIDTKDNYEAVATKFVDVNDSTKVYTTEQLLALTQSTEVNPIYEFPTIYTAVFRAEKGGASSLKGKAYNAFNPITKYVRLTESENTKGILTSPDSSVVTLKGGYTTDYVWKAENSAYSNVKAGEALTVGQMSIANDTMYFYLSFTAPAPDPQPVYNGGGGSGGGGGGGSSASVPATDNAAVNQAQAQAPSQPQGPAEVPSNSNPFGIEVVANAFGVAQQLTAAETGMLQMAKASAVMQQALANPTAAPTKVSETSVKASEANWTKGADGLWSLSTANSEPIKDTWQKVEVAAGVEGWYKFDANGKMQTGWVADGNRVFFLIESGTNQGQMVRNTTVNIGGFEFKFAADGSLETMGAK